MAEMTYVNLARLGGIAIVAGAGSSALAQDLEGIYGGLSLAIPNASLDYGSDSYSFANGAIGGAFVGYNMVRGDWVFGGELAWNGAMSVDSDDFPSYDTPGLKNMIDLKARAGMVFGNTLVYGAVGYSTGAIDGFGNSDGAKASGVNVGVGFEAAIGSNGFWGGEVLTRDLNSSGDINGGPADNYYPDHRLTTVSLRAGFRF